MAGLLGQRDELLRLIEDAFADVPSWCAATRSPSRATTPSGDRAGSSRSWSSCSSRARASTPSQVEPDHRHGASDDVRPSEVLTTEVLRSARGRTVRPKTAGQKRYTDAIANNIVTFGIGPAGTGKSYLAVALAVQALQARQVEPHHPDPAGRRGRRAARASCPATCMAKVDPYLRPLYDALYDLLGGRGRPAPARPRDRSRWPRWPSCGAGPSTTASSSSTRPRTRRPSR